MKLARFRVFVLALALACKAGPPSAEGDAGSPGSGEEAEPGPSILSIEPPTAAPDGVLEVTTEGLLRDQLASIRVGDREISLADPAQFVWIGNSAGVQTLLVRVPSDLELGTAPLRLVRSDQAEAVQFLAIVAAGGWVPSSPRLIWPVSRAAFSDGVFPVGTSSTCSSFPLLIEQTDTAGGHWRYDLSFQRECASGKPELLQSTSGRLFGREAFYEELPAPDFEGEAGCAPEGGAVCSFFEGEYQLGAQQNRVSLTIHRAQRDEPYRGGWVVVPAGVSEGGFLQPGEDGRAVLVLNSTQTGRQLAIAHPFRPSCDIPSCRTGSRATTAVSR